MSTPSYTGAPRLADWPLWRLLVALDDAERTTGPNSSTTRTLARLVSDRLRQERAPEPSLRQEATHALS
jgi:hypothetical protein